MLTLKGVIREKKSNLHNLRAEGFIPAVYYGNKEPATACSVSAGDFRKVWKEAGESSIVVLETKKGNINTLIHDVQTDPVRGNLVHVDFYVLETGKKVKVHIPIEFVGTAPAVKDYGGTLVKVLHEIEIESLPENLPHSVSVDIAPLLSAESQILAKDIALPGGVSLVANGTDVVAAIAIAKEETEQSETMDLSSIEVEKKGKKEENAGEGSAD